MVVAPHRRLGLGVGEPLERGAGEIDKIGRHQRQHAGRQEADQAREQRGGDGDIGAHGRPRCEQPRAAMCKPDRTAHRPDVIGGDMRSARRPRSVIGTERWPRNLITDVPGRAGRPCRGCARRLRRHRGRVRRAGGRLDRRARRRARARARPTCSIRRRRSSASTRSRSPAARRSGSMPAPACRPGCASRAAALPVRTRAGADRARRDPVRSAQRRRQGLGPLSALSRSRLCGRGRRRAPTSRSAASAPASAPPPSISRAASARPRR